MATTDTVPLWDPKRNDIVDVPRNVADNLVRTGYHYKMGDDAENELSDHGAVGAAKATAHSYINSLGFGVPDIIASNIPSMLGGDTVRSAVKRVHHEEEVHPNYATAGDVAGYFGPGGLLHVAGKGAEKVGMHALLSAAAKNTPQHLAQNIGAEAAAKYGFGEAAQRIAGKAGSAVGFGAENAVRGAAKADVDEQLYDTKYDVEKVAQAAGYDFMTGLATDATFGTAGEGFRGLRKGVSKTADYAEKIFPNKLVKDGANDVREIMVPKIALKRTKRTVDKVKTSTRTGGGFEQGESKGRVKTHDMEFEETKTKAENEIDDRYDKQTTTKTKPKPSHTVQYKENIYDTDAKAPTDDEPLGFAWDKDAQPHEIVAAIRDELDKTVAGDPTDFEMSRKVMENEADYKQAMAEERHGDAYRFKKEKDEYQKYLKDKYKDYGPLLEEYEKVMNGKHELFDPSKEFVRKEPKKIGVKTTTEISGQEPEVVEKEKVKNDNYHSDSEHTTARRKTVKDALDETKTKYKKDLDKAEEVKETTVYNDKHEPITYMVPKKETIKHFKTQYNSKIPWQAKAAVSYIGHVTGTNTVLAPMMAADIAIPHVLSNRGFYSNQLDRLTKKPTEQMGKLLRNLTTSKIKDDYSDAGKFSRQLRNPDKLYNQVTKHLQAQAGNPDATRQQVMSSFGHVGAEHPQLMTGLIVHTQNVAQAALPHIPPDTRPPTAQHTPYNPPRSQKVKFLKLFHAMNQPLAALESPTPQIVQAVKQTNPETLALVRRALAGHIAKGGEPFKGKTAAAVSMILGEPINPRQVPAYLKRLQETAALDAPATEPSGGNMAGPHAGSIAGPKSAKVQQDASMLYATPQQLHELA